MRVIVVNRHSFQTIEWINIVRVSISGTDWHVTNVADVSVAYPVADYNVFIIGAEV